MQIKPKRTFSWFLENGLVYLLLIFVIFFFTLGGMYPFNFSGLNRTVGWLWEITNVRFYFPLMLFSYLIGCMLLTLLKRRTHKIMAFLFLLVLILGVLMNSLGLYQNEAVLNILSVFLFGVLFFESLFAKKGNP